MRLFFKPVIILVAGLLPVLANCVDEGATNDGPVVAAGLDSDGDGLTDEHEHELGTDAEHADSDEDGAPDGAEWHSGTDPLDQSDHDAHHCDCPPGMALDDTGHCTEQDHCDGDHDGCDPHVVDWQDCWCDAMCSDGGLCSAGVCQSGDDHSDDGTGDHHSDDGTGDHPSDDGTGDDHTGDGTGDDHTDDGTGDHHTGD